MINQIKYGILCFHLFTLNANVSYSSSNVTKWGKNEQQNIHYEKCEEDELHFQCTCGACIEKKYQCDGLKHCADGSDELPHICGVIDDEHKSVRIIRDANKSCMAPASSVDKTISFVCYGNPSNSCTPSKDYFPELTVATITCATDYYREDSNPSSVHFCYDNKWSPLITKCLKKCDKLNPINVVLECFRGGIIIENCDENSVLFAGTKVYPSCKSSYKYNTPPMYYEITCNDDGRWNNILLPCVAECGKPYTSAKVLISGGKEEKIGGSPWHVAIFEKKTGILICGGTIISENLVISAAHCFSKEICNDTSCTDDNCEGIHCINDYEVVVGKYTNNYTVIDTQYQRIMKVKEIRLPKSGYLGIKTYHTSDIAVLILRDRIPISPAVLPACLNWDDLKNDKTPLEGEPGKVVGWGRTENGTLSTILRSINLPFISPKQCLEIVDNDFRPFVTLDKFCGGTRNRTGVTLLDGDSGGGILFEYRGLFYLRGVVSVKQYSSNSVTIFTDLSKHVQWLISVYDDFETQSPIGQNQIQSSNSLDLNRIHQVVYNKNTYSNQEEAKRQLLPEIVTDIKSQRFHIADQKLGLLQQDNDLYYHVVHEVYNNLSINFDLLLNFGNSIRIPERKFKIYEFLYNETASSGHKDPQKIILLAEALTRALKDTPYSSIAVLKLYQSLEHAIVETAIEPISKVLLNNTSWEMIEELTNTICAICYECTLEIYKSVVEIVWNKISLEHLLRRVLEKRGFIAEHIAVHLAVVDKLERLGALNTSLAITLAKYIDATMSIPSYYGIQSFIKLMYEEARNRLPQSVNKNTIISNDVQSKSRKEVDHQLISDLVNDIKSQSFPKAELTLSQMDSDTYSNTMHKVYDNQSINFDSLLTFADSMNSVENKFKMQEFLYNETVQNGPNDTQKLLILRQSIRKALNSTSSIAMLKLHNNLNNAIVKSAVQPISSAFQNDKLWPMVQILIGNISAVCFECTEKIYGIVLENVWDTITLEELLRKTDVRNLGNITEVIKVHLAATDKLERAGALNSTSAITLANYIDSTVNSPLYFDISPYLELRYEEVKKKLPQSVNRHKSDSNDEEIKIQQKYSYSHQSIAEIVQDVKSHQFSTAEKKLSQMDSNAYLNIVNEVYNNQASHFDLLLSFGDSINDVENKLKIYEFLYNRTAFDDLKDTRILLQLSQSVKNKILDQSTGPFAIQAQEFYFSLKTATMKAAVEHIFLAFQNDDSWLMINELSMNISSNCWNCTVMIYKSVVERVWNEIPLEYLLRKTDENITDLTAVIAIHVAVTDTLERTGALYTIASITLARYMKSTMDLSNYIGTNSDLQSQYKDAKNKLPQSVKNLVFSSAICIKNIKYNEYLYATISSNEIYKSDNHRVYTWISGNNNKTPKFKWYVSFWHSTQIQLRDDRFSEYLFAGSQTYDDSRRYVSTWNTNTPKENVAWDLEVDGNYIRIKDNFYQEYLFADYAKKENLSRRCVFTYRHEGRTSSDSQWQFDDCSY